MDSRKELAYLSLKEEIGDFLKKESTQNKISEYSDKALAKSHIKKHLLLSGKGTIDDIQKILDELL